MLVLASQNGRMKSQGQQRERKTYRLLSESTKVSKVRGVPTGLPPRISVSDFLLGTYQELDNSL